MKFILNGLLIASLIAILCLQNGSSLLAATNGELKGGISEKQTFVEEAPENPSHTGPIEIKSISPEEAAGQINYIFSSAYELLNQISPYGLGIALVILFFTGPFINHFFLRLAISVLSFIAIQNMPFIVGILQGLASKINT